MATRKRSATRKPSAAARARKSGGARKRLTPPAEQRGLAADALAAAAEDPALRPLRESVLRLGGAALGAYREPFAGRAVLLASVPLAGIEPTPFQRDLSPTHAKRLAEKIAETGAFLDPLIAVLGPDGRLWTPNGRHRLAAARLLGLRAVTVLLAAEPALAYRILALNTEKAHNLRDRSLEVIRMARALAEAAPRSREADYGAEFEAAALLTLGQAYEQDKRFPGSAYHPLLRRVDVFSEKPLRTSLRERTGWATRLLEIDAGVRELVAQLQARGFRSPYLRSLVVARINPVRPPARGRAAARSAPSMTLPAALTRLAANARRFDPASVRERDLALVAAVAAEPAD